MTGEQSGRQSERARSACLEFLPRPDVQHVQAWQALSLLVSLYWKIENRRMGLQSSGYSPQVCGGQGKEPSRFVVCEYNMPWVRWKIENRRMGLQSSGYSPQVCGGQGKEPSRFVVCEYNMPWVRSIRSWGGSGSASVVGYKAGVYPSDSENRPAPKRTHLPRRQGMDAKGMDAEKATTGGQFR